MKDEPTVAFYVSNISPAAGEVISITLRVENTANHRLEIGPEIWMYEGEMSYSNPTQQRLSSEGVFLTKEGSGATSIYEKTVPFTVPDRPAGTLFTAHSRVLKQGGALFNDAPFTVA